MEEKDDEDDDLEDDTNSPLMVLPSIRTLRFTYLWVILVVYLADGLQGTHLYKLYEDHHGVSLASFYGWGYLTGGLLSPLTGPWVDQMGRKRAAIVYCVLEMVLNTMEQFSHRACLMASRILSGFTTNLLHCVFETWLDSEFRTQTQTHWLQLQQQQERQRQNQQQLRHSKQGHHDDDDDQQQQQAKLELVYQQEYELLMRDSVIVSNTAAVGSGFLSHILADWYGPVGPFRGAVVCTLAALVVVVGLWTENYGGILMANPTPHPQKQKPAPKQKRTREHHQQQQVYAPKSHPLPHHSPPLMADHDKNPGNHVDLDASKDGLDWSTPSSSKLSSSQHNNKSTTSIWTLWRQAAQAFGADRNMLRVGIVQGLSVGSLQIFVFLWSPVLMELAQLQQRQQPPQQHHHNSNNLRHHTSIMRTMTHWGLDRYGEPAFGLIFMAFMGSCVVGGLGAPTLRKAVTALLTPIKEEETDRILTTTTTMTRRPMAVEFLAASGYFMCALLLAVPCWATSRPGDGFAWSLLAFCWLEFWIGIVSPCEGVIRSLYFPSQARASVWTLPSMLINAAASLAVFGTHLVSLRTMCAIVSALMMTASALQLSLITPQEWSTVQSRIQRSLRYCAQQVVLFNTKTRRIPKTPCPKQYGTST
ncbi:hypothetical protein ACA910_009521 [Epithemia clementina (nom. ined.)]